MEPGVGLERRVGRRRRATRRRRTEGWHGGSTSGAAAAGTEPAGARVEAPDAEGGAGPAAALNILAFSRTGRQNLNGGKVGAIGETSNAEEPGVGWNAGLAAVSRLLRCPSVDDEGKDEREGERKDDPQSCSGERASAERCESESLVLLSPEEEWDEAAGSTG